MSAYEGHDTQHRVTSSPVVTPPPATMRRTLPLTIRTKDEGGWHDIRVTVSGRPGIESPLQAGLLDGCGQLDCRVAFHSPSIAGEPSETDLVLYLPSRTWVTLVLASVEPRVNITPGLSFPLASASAIRKHQRLRRHSTCRCRRRPGLSPRRRA